MGETLPTLWGTLGRARRLSHFAHGKGRSARVFRLVQAWRRKLDDDAISKQVVRIRIRLGKTKQTASERSMPGDRCRREASAII
jgi:hypothetical protein